MKTSIIKEVRMRFLIDDNELIIKLFDPVFSDRLVGIIKFNRNEILSLKDAIKDYV